MMVRGVLEEELLSGILKHVVCDIGLIKQDGCRQIRATSCDDLL